MIAMNPQLLFVISAPRSGSTMLERMLESHSEILGGPEPHLMTPLAHLGPWAKVDKAPYDHILAAESQKHFIERLPGGDADYWAACRAYCDALYGKLMEDSKKSVCLDKTPAYALVLPFMRKVYPDAKYVVLTRHPLATFSSFANSFFDGDYNVAQEHNPLLERYVPALAAMLRQTDVPVVHVRYEDLVQDPESGMRRIYEYIGVPFEAETINYGDREPSVDHGKGLGDPIGVQQHSRPTTASIEKWIDELAADEAKRRMMQGIVAKLDPADLATLGYPVEEIWRPLEDAGVRPVPKTPKLTRYRLQRKLIVRLRAIARGNAAVRSLLERLRLACDVLLRE
jgi:hypothetical protein